MPQHKRKASAIASAKIAEAGSGRRRKSDTAKEQRIKKHNNGNENVKGDKIEQNVSDDKKEESVQEQPDNKRHKKSEGPHEQKDGNGVIVDNRSNEVKSEQEHDQMIVDIEATTQQNVDQSKGEQEINKQPDQNQVQIKTIKELEKKMSPNVLEKGHICFLFRPKIGVEEPSSADETQRMYMILIPYMVRPSVSEEPIPSYFNQSVVNKQFKADEPIPGKTRVIVIGKKKLPEIERHTKFWSYVDKVFNNMDDLKEFTSGRKYQTSTRGERALDACRIMGRGVYNIVEHKGHTHLAYVMEFPEEPSEVQKEFNIKHEGSYVITIKNPEGISGGEKINYPSHLLDKFKGLRFISLLSPEFLDYEGTELILIGAKEDVIGELGEAGNELEELADFEIKEIAPLSAERVIYEELRLEKDALPSEPLHGFWK